jgi:phosphoribosylformylglycinamidine cyclo-ligase
MVAAVSPDEAEAITTELEAAGETVFAIGTVERGERGCTVSGAVEIWSARRRWSATHNG